MLNTTIIVSDEKVNIGDWYNSNLGINKLGETTRNVEKYRQKVIAGIEGLPSIDWNGLEEEFGWVDVKSAIGDIEECHYESPVDFLGTGDNSKIADSEEKRWDSKFRNALNILKKAQFLNDKKFSLDDIKKAIEMTREGKSSFKFDNEGIVYKYTEEEIIQSLSTQHLPKVFDIEVETVRCVNPDIINMSSKEYFIPKITNDSIKILKNYGRTINNI